MAAGADCTSLSAVIALHCSPNALLTVTADCRPPGALLVALLCMRCAVCSVVDAEGDPSTAWGSERQPPLDLSASYISP